MTEHSSVSVATVISGMLFTISHFLQFRQVGIWIAAKAGTQSARLTPLIETVAKLLPLAAIHAAQVSTAGWRLAGGDGRDQARLTAQPDGGRGGLAAGGPSLVV